MIFNYSEKINKLQSILDDPAFGAPDSLKVQAKRNIAKVLRDIERSRRELNAEKERSSVTEQYWQKVEQARRHFQVGEGGKNILNSKDLINI